jgi:integrase
MADDERLTRMFELTSQGRETATKLVAAQETNMRRSDELYAWLMQRTTVFATRTGKRMGAENFRNRVLAAAVKRANERLEVRGEVPLPKLKPHSLRRTFASLLYAIGEPPPVAMAEMGHADAGLALRIYAQAMRCSDEEKEQLRALVDGEPVAGSAADMGTPGHSEAETAAEKLDGDATATVEDRL